MENVYERPWELSDNMSLESGCCRPHNESQSDRNSFNGLLIVGAIIAVPSSIQRIEGNLNGFTLYLTTPRETTRRVSIRWLVFTAFRTGL